MKQLLAINLAIVKKSVHYSVSRQSIGGPQCRQHYNSGSKIGLSRLRQQKPPEAMPHHAPYNAFDGAFIICSFLF